MRSTAKRTNSAEETSASSKTSWEIEMLHDGDCPLCTREVAMLRKRDREGKIRFTDIAAADFDSSAYGKDREELMAEIHARLPDGTWIRGVEVFRRLYAAVGFRRLAALSRLPVVSQLLGLGYRVFAKNRLRLTGRCDSKGKVCQVSPTAPAAPKPDVRDG